LQAAVENMRAFPTKSGDPNYRIITAFRKQFLHYYFYVLDPVMGPMSLRIATYIPFNVTCYLNGHSFMAQELTRQGIAFEKDDNAFVGAADLPAPSQRQTTCIATLDYPNGHGEGRRVPCTIRGHTGRSLVHLVHYR
jgi:hypothetical protein